MTFVGKVLVIVQVVLSLCFMAFAGAVYTVQQDWKVAHDRKVEELNQKNEQLREKDEQITFLSKDLAATQAIQTDINNYLQGVDQFLAGISDDDRIKTQLRNLARRLEQAESKVRKLDEDVADEKQRYRALEQNYISEKAAKEKAQEEASERAQEADIFKKQNKDLNNQVAQLNDRVFNLEDELFNRETEAKTAADKQKSLLVQVAFLKDVIRREGIDEEEALKKAEPPPLVYGKVINTKPADRTGPEYVEISLGSDDGLAEGHKLYVFSTKGRGKYMGEIRLVHVVADRAVGEVMLKSKNGIIQRGDNVATKL